MSKTEKRGTAIDLWHGPLTAAEIAAQCGFETVRGLQLFWQRRKLDGALPMEARPRFAQACAPAIESEGDDRDATAFDADGGAIKGSAIAGSLGLAVPPGDPLLCAMRMVHGADRWRRLDGMPAQTLEQECRIAPSRQAVAEFALIRDRYTAALMSVAR
jgi:hypothetical protein